MPFDRPSLPEESYPNLACTARDGLDLPTLAAGRGQDCECKSYAGIGMVEQGIDGPVEQFHTLGTAL